MKMKRILLTFITAAVMVSALTACNNADKGDKDTDKNIGVSEAPSSSQGSEKPTEKPENKPAVQLCEDAPQSGVSINSVAKADTPEQRFAEHPALLLWEDTAQIPGEFNNVPTIVPYLSSESRGAIVLFQSVSDDGKYYISEGAPVAEYLNGMGYDVFICKYRLATAYTDDVAEDARRAVRYVRYYEEDFGIVGKKIAVMGFGDGALLAYIEACDCAVDGSAADEIDLVLAKPDFTLLFNPDISPSGGMFKGATSKYPISSGAKVFIGYDSTVSYAGDILRFAFSLKDERNLSGTEVHGFTPLSNYSEGANRTDGYESLYNLLKNYLVSSGFNK